MDDFFFALHLYSILLRIYAVPYHDIHLIYFLLLIVCLFFNCFFCFLKFECVPLFSPPIVVTIFWLVVFPYLLFFISCASFLLSFLFPITLAPAFVVILTLFASRGKGMKIFYRVTLLFHFIAYLRSSLSWYLCKVFTIELLHYVFYSYSLNTYLWQKILNKFGVQFLKILI